MDTITTIGRFPVMMPESPSILFITARPPYQAVGGAGTATRGLIELLQQEPISARIVIEAIRPRSPRLSRPIRQGIALLRSITSELSSKSLFDLPAGSLRRLRRLLSSQRYDLIVVDGGQLFFLARYLSADTAAVGIAHNVESRLYADQTVALRKNFFAGRFFARDLKKLESCEKEGLRCLGRIVCLSREDAIVLSKIEPSIEIISQPATFSYRPHRRDRHRSVERPLKLGFLGKFSWWPNVEAIQWLAERVLPRLSEGMAEVHLYGPGAERFKNRHPGIIVHGYVSDLATVWQRSDILICPMRSGSGINVKFIEAIYNGVPVLATSYASRGLPHFDDHAVVYLDEAEEWVAFLCSDAAIRLARSEPDEGTRDIFSSRGSAARLFEFLSKAVGEAVSE